MLWLASLLCVEGLCGSGSSFKVSSSPACSRVPAATVLTTPRPFFASICAHVGDVRVGLHVWSQRRLFSSMMTSNCSVELHSCIWTRPSVSWTKILGNHFSVPPPCHQPWNNPSPLHSCHCVPCLSNQHLSYILPTFPFPVPQIDVMHSFPELVDLVLRDFLPCILLILSFQGHRSVYSICDTRNKHHCHARVLKARPDPLVVQSSILLCESCVRGLQAHVQQSRGLHIVIQRCCCRAYH